MYSSYADDINIVAKAPLQNSVGILEANTKESIQQIADSSVGLILHQSIKVTIAYSSKHPNYKSLRVRIGRKLRMIRPRYFVPVMPNSLNTYPTRTRPK